VKDGRRDGREGASGATAINEVPAGLNPQIIQNVAATTGVTHQLQNLFAGEALTTPVYVIPTGEKMTVTIIYDVETANPDLSGYLSDGITHGVSVENKITKEITWNEGTGLESGKKYTLKLHLGMNSVKLDAVVGEWDDTAVNGEGWLPYNLATDPPVALSLGTNITMQLTDGVGSPQTLTATTKPVNESVNWSNSNDAVATIAPSVSPARAFTRGEAGPCSSVVITPVAVGTTIVTATTSFGSAQCVVTVIEEDTPEVTVTLDETTKTLYAGGATFTLGATTAPASRPLTWVSSNTAAATVDANGQITTASAGLTYITATTESGNSANCTVTVVPTELTLDKSSLTLIEGNDATLNATTTPEGRTVTWVSDNTGVATVNSSGQVTAVAIGTAKITASITGGGTATCNVTVTGGTASVSTAPTALDITYNGAAQTLVTAGEALHGTMVYATGTSSAATSAWTSSIPKATDAGTYYVWYKAEGTGSYTDSTPAMVEVTMAKKAATISFATASYNKTIGAAAFTQTATITGGGTIAYSISNSGSNATINASTGEVSVGSAVGTATVTATVTPDANHSYAETTATYTIAITLPDANVDTTSGVSDWSGNGNLDNLSGDKNGL